MFGRKPRDSLSTALDMRIERIMQAQEMKAERRVNVVRFVFSIFGLAGMFLVWQANTRLANEIFVVLGLIWLLYSGVIFVYLRMLKERCVWWLKYLTISLDLSLLSMTALASHVNHPGIAEYFLGTASFFFVFWNLVSGLRLSLPAGIYSSVLTLVLNSGILILAVLTGAVETAATSTATGTAINIADQMTTIVTISLPGILAGFMSHSARSLLWRAELQSAQRARLEKEKTRLGKYLSPEIVDYIVKDPDRLVLGGKRKDATIMFTDIRNFTPYSDTHDPEEVVRFLNRYFTRMVSIVFQTGGTLDKYIGDGLLAEYGVPFSVENAPLRALLASLKMMQELENLNSAMKEREFGDIEIGVGIATGPVLAGNIGSLERMEYTCIGATVNTAARLERLNRDMGTHIIICEKTYTAVHDVVPAKRLPPMKVKGAQAAGLYAVELPDDVPALIRSLETLVEHAKHPVETVEAELS